eukprot:TRINITY_DN21008_c0_g1_i1.p1 TRINITY_DN21008_c0_g1~~TRINITY_DN21008_c0_g1_i1.p1  ORF type:complete len:291 (-),score=38.87 TRINITY_DN21008_c0_g1_i1:1143-2015(-)
MKRLAMMSAIAAIAVCFPDDVYFKDNHGTVQVLAKGTDTTSVAFTPDRSGRGLVSMTGDSSGDHVYFCYGNGSLAVFDRVSSSSVVFFTSAGCSDGLLVHQDTLFYTCSQSTQICRIQTPAFPIWHPTQPSPTVVARAVGSSHFLEFGLDVSEDGRNLTIVVTATPQSSLSNNALWSVDVATGTILPFVTGNAAYNCRNGIVDRATHTVYWTGGLDSSAPFCTAPLANPSVARCISLLGGAVAAPGAISSRTGAMYAPVALSRIASIEGSGPGARVGDVVSVGSVYVIAV